MLCKKCGRTLPDDSLFCQYCGAHFEDLTEEAEPVAEEPVVEEPIVEEPEPQSEVTKAAPIEEPPAATPAEPKQPAGKATYCKHCGGLVDPETKKCTKCGKQYFKLPKNIVRKSIVALLFLAMAGGLVYLFLQNQALAQELDAKTKDASRFENLYKGAESNADSWKEKYLSIYDEYQFYHNYAVIVGEGITNYHSYGCSRLIDSNGNWKTDGFWIYNIAAAQGDDYDPCPECQ